MDFIVCHMNADFDALASMMAARKLYPGAEPVFPGSQEKKVREFIEAFDPFPTRRLRDVDISKAKRLIVVDTKSPEKTGPFAKLIKDPKVKVHLYDHHPHGKDDIHGALEVIEEVGATATVFTEIIREKGIKLTPMEATMLCMGIYEETGNLLFPITTTERDLMAVAWLLKNGASLKIVSSYMKTELSRSELGLLNELTQSAVHEVVQGVRVTTAKASRDDYQGDAAHLAHSIMDMEDTDALALMLRMHGKILIIGRSRMPELNIGEALEEFGGGGHPTAASATVGDLPLEILEERLWEVIRQTVRPTKVASDIMTRPVVTIEAGSTIKDAESRMTRYGVNVLPVVREGGYRGIITREVVEKAIFHGFRTKKIMDFTSTDVTTAGKDTSVREMETTMIEQNQRFMPVVDGKKIIGAITRTDLLRVLYEDYLRRSGFKEQAAEGRIAIKRSLSAWLRNKFPKNIYETLRSAGAVARDLQYNAYLVGGSVRDLLMGGEHPEMDIDIVVEGDGIEFARKLAGKLGARVRAHERFATAKVIGRDIKLDVATARTEYYESPASLPTVEMSSIKKDLYRRDFTINTLAVKLTSPDFGKLVDFFGGQRDLKDRTIRVLHDLSFVEDPTRAFRAMRFAERFGFKLSRHTENLIKSALRMKLFEKLSGARLYDELMMIFDEAEPVKVIERLAGHDLLGVIHPGLVWNDRLSTLLHSAHDTLIWFGLSFLEEKVDRGQIYLMALFSGLKDDEKLEALRRLAVHPRMEKAVLRNSHEAREAVKLFPLEDPAEVYDTLHGLSTETVLLAMAHTGEQAKKMQISRYLLELRRTKTILRGNDLKKMGIAPGPVYSEILKEILHEKLRGALPDREDEERFVRERLGSARPAGA
jgi:tRNA nucleotidyltransferase (CCA-adding enzyme)